MVIFISHLRYCAFIDWPILEIIVVIIDDDQLLVVFIGPFINEKYLFSFYIVAINVIIVLSHLLSIYYYWYY